MGRKVQGCVACTVLLVDVCTMAQQASQKCPVNAYRSKLNSPANTLHDSRFRLGRLGMQELLVSIACTDARAAKSGKAQLTRFFHDMIAVDPILHEAAEILRAC